MDQYKYSLHLYFSSEVYQIVPTTNIKLEFQDILGNYDIITDKEEIAKFLLGLENTENKDNLLDDSKFTSVRITYGSTNIQPELRSMSYWFNTLEGWVGCISFENFIDRENSIRNALTSLTSLATALQVFISPGGMERSLRQIVADHMKDVGLGDTDG